MKNLTFGRLLKGAIGSIATYENTTAPVIEADLGQKLGLSGASIQRYKSGHIPPEMRTIEILAEAAIKRGYLNRIWLQHFLRAALYPLSEKLMDELCPSVAVRPRPSRVYENLPAPTYSKFVMRDGPFHDAMDGLQQRSAVVLIASLGGMGKTSLAREVAARCLHGDSDVPRFDAVVWVSDKDRPGTTTLTQVLDEIARTLDYPGIVQYDTHEKQREVELLLRSLRVLLIIDNFETINDGTLVTWLLRLPEPSKAIVTSREYSRAFRNNTFVIDLLGMNEVESMQFISQRLHALRMYHLVTDLSQLAPLIKITGGNPKAIEITLGCLKYKHQSLPEVIEDLYSARGDLFSDLFGRSWALLDGEARRILLSMPFFSVSAGRKALATTADVQEFALDSALERLTDLALLDIQQSNLSSEARYALHPLVRAFAATELGKQPDFERGARHRWVNWYIQLTSSVGYCWDNLTRLEILDPEHETILAAANWTLNHGYYVESLRISEAAGYYFFIRGLWEKNPPVNLIAAEAARRLSDLTRQAEATAYHVQLLAKQGNVSEAEKYLPRLHEWAQTVSLPGDVFFLIYHAVALYWMARDDIDAAQQAWLTSFSRAEELSEHVHILNRQWLATCLYRKAHVTEAAEMFRGALEDAIRIGLQQAIVSCGTQLAAIDIDQGNLESAARALSEFSVQAYRYQDRGAIAESQRIYARLHARRHDYLAARSCFLEAIDLFERLGMRLELAEARRELAELDLVIDSEASA